jgi:putative Mg2+ transporter-C (MgtC) family protein
VLGVSAPFNANILSGVVTGIGFIGAGAIIKEGAAVTGHATAASIWTVGIIGAAVGYGYYDIGLILAAANLAVLMLRAPFLVRSAAPENPPDE